MPEALPEALVPLLGGGVLLLSFALVLRRRVLAAIQALTAQGVLLAMAALCHAWSRGDAGASGLPLVALLLLLGQGLLLPLALREWVRRQGLRREPAAAPVSHPLAGLAAAVALVLLAVLAVHPVTDGAAAPLRETLVLSLSVLLVGLLVTAARRGPLGQVIGLACAMNGVLLAALALPALPMLPALVVVAMALPFGITAGFLTLRPQTGKDPA
ncbi:hydrogenase-4 component E [Roseomonas marmotae]|uniref:Hydrogenase-4 component E n=1 Tax=Roseomonas marmotae TaxID=2768161 RepID=A0ABS3K9I9_9PROT|nr:hydrogenase-4 component E [Roseomonas marmotae]MBO1073595.1 hydrogenase-4 component E [Roseomonas marmotae]QTI80224.1 hydrogenase-4 component E [Roseomonas marmotae]